MKSEAALAAKAIRSELKKLFPKTKFSVCCKNYSCGNSVTIQWDNGVTQAKVDQVVAKYQYGHFDGMCDIYLNSNRIDGIPQVKFVFTDRSIDPSVLQQAFDYLKEVYSPFKSVQKLYDFIPDLNRSAYEYVIRGFKNYDLTNGYCTEQYGNHVFNR